MIEHSQPHLSGGWQSLTDEFLLVIHPEWTVSPLSEKQRRPGARDGSHLPGPYLVHWALPVAGGGWCNGRARGQVLPKLWAPQIQAQYSGHHYSRLMRNQPNLAYQPGFPNV